MVPPVPIERSEEYLSLCPQPEEEEAIRLCWEAEGSEGPVPAAEAIRHLQYVRSRREAIEASALDMLHQALSEGRRTPRRHQALAMKTLILLGLGLAAIAWLLNH